MRHLISTLQTHNQQMKGEVVKYKLRLREAQSELNQVCQKETKNAVLSAKYSLCFVYECSQSLRLHGSWQLATTHTGTVAIVELLRIVCVTSIL